jgi:hypothetical protein
MISDLVASAFVQAINDDEIPLVRRNEALKYVIQFVRSAEYSAA